MNEKNWSEIEESLYNFLLKEREHAKKQNVSEEYVVFRLQTLEQRLEYLTNELNRERRRGETNCKALEAISKNAKIYEAGDQSFINVELIRIDEFSRWLVEALGLKKEEPKNEEA